MATRQANTGEALRRIEEAQRSRATQLNLAGLDLTAIPDSLAQLTNLNILDLSANQITAIPDTLAQLTNLWILNLNNNQITAIPDTLAQLAILQYLNLSNNQITAIPDVQLTYLQTLGLSNNQITALPDSLAQLTSLQSLGLSFNRITAIPDSLAQLTNLRYLDLSNNQITAIPDCLAQLTNLTRLFLHGNPALGIPREILGPTWQDSNDYAKPPKPPTEILTYYFSQRAGSRPLNEAKLILVGQGAVGKTSLVNTLITGSFETREQTTEGIKISDWTCPLTPADQATIHIWDFGGQELMHATHQFFLTKRSLYLLVLNRRQGGHDKEAGYWLSLIRAFGGKDAPVLIVLNKQKSEPFDVNRGAWLEKYAENIKGFVQTDCTDAESITQFKRTIQQQIQQLKDVQTKFPDRWFSIKNELSRMQSEYVTFESYRAICRKHGENDPDSQTSLAGFLHDLGIALNYKDDPRLRFAYVLKPEWITGGIYALIHAFVQSKGLFTHAEAEKILSRQNYPEEAVNFILSLMERFELIFALDDRQSRYLIPQLLDDQQPDLARDFNLSQCLNFGYQYPIVPEGLLPRFVVRTQHLSGPETRWKSGVILQHPESGCRALVRADSTQNQVRIHIDGPESSRRDLLVIVRHNFDIIHADYEFKPADLVYPTPDKPLQLAELQAYLDSGILTVPVLQPNKTATQQSIATLLEPAEAGPPPLKVFLSYSHKDEKHVDELRKDLKLMERNGLIRTWYDRGLTAGEKWEPRILQEINDADVIICQLSRDFLASDFCVLRELQAAIERKEAGQAELIAYVVRECGWKEIPNLSQFQILPREAKPLSSWRAKDKYWRTIAEEIQKSIKKLQAKKPVTNIFTHPTHSI